MKRATWLFALVLLGSPALADFADLPPNVRNNLSAIQKYPKAASLLLWCSETFALNPDGSQSYEWHSFRYFPDEAARDTWGDPRINYADGRQKVDVLRARTYTADGRHIDCTPENAYNPVVPDGLDLAPDFGEYRQMVVTLLGLENGSISELHYRLTTARPLFPWLEGRVYFREEVPVITRELILVIPDGVTLKYQVERGVPEPAVVGNRYTWRMGELPGYLPEDLAGHRILLPNVTFTTAANWDQICRELSRRIEASSSQQILPPKSLKESLNSLKTDEIRLEGIQRWVRERFRKIHFDHPEALISLRPCSRILHSGYGNGLELAVLVRSLANHWGIRCDLVPRFVPEPVLPSLHEWADPVLAVRPDNASVYYVDPLAPRSELTAADLEGSWLLDLSSKADQDRLTRLTTRTKGTPRFELWLSLQNLEKDTVRGNGALISVGSWGCLERIQEKGQAGFLNSLITLPGFACSNPRVRELSDRTRVALDFDFTIARLDTADQFHILPLSAFDFSKLVKNAPLSLPRREFAQELPLMGEIALHLDAAIPEKWQIVRKPGSSSEVWDWSKGEIRCDVQDGRLSFERRLSLAREWLAPSDWNGFRKWIIESGPRHGNSVVFEAVE